MDKNLSQFKLNIIGLSNKVHEFDLEFGDEFFQSFESSLVEKGDFKSSLKLDRSDTMIVIELVLSGVAHLVCDRSLEEFDFPINITERVIYKYGDKFEELDDTLFTIPFGAESLDLSNLFYDLINVQIPMKKLHPKFEGDEEDLDEEDVFVYSSNEEEEGVEEEEDQKVDPRWSKLMDLNNKLNNDGAS